MNATTLHTCSVCGKTGAWSRAWQWYGSVLQMEADPRSVDKTCSAACRKKHVPSAEAKPAHRRAVAAHRAQEGGCR